MSLSSSQAPGRPAAGRRLRLQPQLAAALLLPVCGHLRRAADAGGRGSLPAPVQPRPGSTRPQPDRELHGSQSVRPALIPQIAKKNQKLIKVLLYCIHTHQAPDTGRIF